jgi:hypothetical protein
MTWARFFSMKRKCQKRSMLGRKAAATSHELSRALTLPIAPRRYRAHCDRSRRRVPGPDNPCAAKCQECPRMGRDDCPQAPSAVRWPRGQFPGLGGSRYVKILRSRLGSLLLPGCWVEFVTVTRKKKVTVKATTKGRKATQKLAKMTILLRARPGQKHVKLDARKPSRRSRRVCRVSR